MVGAPCKPIAHAVRCPSSLTNGGIITGKSAVANSPGQKPCSDAAPCCLDGCDLCSPLPLPKKGWRTDRTVNCFTTNLARKGNVVQAVTRRCKQLNCEYCGPFKRRADLERCISDLGQGQLYLTYVHETTATKLAKHLGYIEAPGWRVPVGREYVAIVTTQPLDTWHPNRQKDPLDREASHACTREELGELFLVDRVCKRHAEPIGAVKQPARPKKKKSEWETISRKGISMAALKEVAIELELKYEEEEGRITVHDNRPDRSTEWWKKILLAKEAEFREREREVRRQRVEKPSS